VTLRFADLNPLGRAIIVVVAALTLAVAAIAFATSYGALYAWARDTGLYSDRLTRIWPLLLDGAFTSPNSPPSWPASCAATAPSPSSPCSSKAP
jgi:hypothetical protein